MDNLHFSALHLAPMKHNYMMKLLVFMVFVVLLSGCANEGSNEKPSAIDTSQHPTGITNSNVISTDTAAMRVDTTQK